MLREQSAGRGEPSSPRGADDKCRTQAGLEPLDVLRDRRLGVSERSSGGTDRSRLIDRDEDAEGMDIERTRQSVDIDVTPSIHSEMLSITRFRWCNNMFLTAFTRHADPTTPERKAGHDNHRGMARAP